MRKKLNYQDPKRIESPRMIDARGAFRPIARGLNLEAFGAIEQVNVSYNSAKGTLRGMHFQINEDTESKLVSCIKGSARDVVINLNSASKSFGLATYFDLSESNDFSLLIPKGFAHGFQTLEDETVLLYLHSGAYSQRNQRVINPLDSELNIDWPLSVTNISDRDASGASFTEYIGALGGV